MDLESMKKEVGKRIKVLRKKNNETQKDLAEAIHISTDSIAKIEQGNVTLTLDNQYKIAEHYHVSHDYICKGGDDSDILNLLESYISIDFQKCSVGENELQYPQLEIKQILFNYLLQFARANATKNIPEDVRQLWIKNEKRKFFNKIKTKNNFEKTTKVAIVKTELIYPDHQKNDWKQSDFLRELDKQIDSLIDET